MEDPDDISDSDDESVIRGVAAADDSELNSNVEGTFSLSLSWVRGQTDGVDLFSLSEVFNQLSEAETVVPNIIIGVLMSPTDDIALFSSVVTETMFSSVTP